MVDRQSGLPMRTVGCEWTREEEAYISDYNAQMARLIEARPPLPATMTITWSAVPVSAQQGPEPAGPARTVVTVSHQGILVDGAAVHSVLADRLRIGLMVQDLFDNPPGTVLDTYSHTLVLEDGDRRERTVWSVGAATVPEPLRQLLESAVP
jgi:hypothetical protein